jgi:hypothetical protein
MGSDRGPRAPSRPRSDVILALPEAEQAPDRVQGLGRQAINESMDLLETFRMRKLVGPGASM